MHRLLPAVLLICLAWPAPAQEIARLYAARPPAGSAYVRLVDPDGPHQAATDYRIVDASIPMPLTVNGKVLAPLRLVAGTFNTVIVANGKALVLLDATDSRDDLKAELRFYNLVPGCQATLALRGGPTVFGPVAYAAPAKRNINPVRAELVGSCAGAGSAAAVALPPLKSGDHVSLFLSGAPGQPRLRVQADATEAVRGAR